MDSTDYYVLNKFFYQMDLHSFVDKHFFDKNLIQLFNGKYNHHLRMFKNSDSICKNSKDTLKRKISCPIADVFKVYDTTLNEKDLLFLSEKYNIKGKRRLINLDSVILETTLRKHSKQYYDNIEYDKYSSISNLNEFPSIRIENLYYNKERDVAIVAYSIVSTTTQISTNFYILKKMDGIWWKPLGAFRI